MNNMSKVLLKNISTLMVSSNEKDLHNVDLFIEGNVIKRVGKNISAVDTKGAKILDCTSCVVIPGLVNTHHHFFQTLTRNIPEVANAKLFTWLKFLYQIWKNIDDEAVFYSSLTAIGELLKSGCTLTTDHHYLYSRFMKDAMGAQFRAARTLGIRFSPTRGSMSLSEKDGGLPPDSVVQSEEEILENCQEVIEKYHNSSWDSMSRIVLAPCSPFSVTPKSMKDAARLARKYKVRLHTHLCETIDEENQSLAMYKLRPVDLMRECEFIGNDVFYAHGIWFNDDELKILKDTGAHIAHCPSSNMRLGSGICRTREMLKLGINVAIAVDGSASNDSSNMLNELRNALLLSRIKYREDGLTSREVLKMGTINGAKLLGYDEKLGELREGWLADIAVFPADDISYVGAHADECGSLLFTQSRNTKYTIVNGKVVVENGELIGMNEKEIVENANKIAKKLYEARK